MYRVGLYKHSTGCQIRLTTGLTNGCIVYTAGCQTEEFIDFMIQVKNEAIHRASPVYSQMGYIGTGLALYQLYLI